MDWMFKKAWVLKLAMNMWPPLLFSRIKITKLTDDYREIEVKMTLSAWNKNPMGAHFGGSLFAMTDPFYMTMLMAHLGKGYIVWDKFSDIDFIKPGRGTVCAKFLISDEILNDIEIHTANGDKYLPVMPVYIHDEKGDVVAKVNKTLYIRKKETK